MRSAVIFLASSTIVLACGGVDGGIIGGDDDSGGGNSDGGGGGNDARPIEGGPNCDISKCAAAPDGFHAVRPAGAKATCPDGWASAVVVSNPIVGDGACTCGCNVTTPPTCNTGDITRYLDGTGTATCGTQGYTFPAASACTAMGVALYLNQYHYSVTGPAAVGGVCAFDATPDTSKVTSTASQLCAPPTSCPGAICNDNGPVCVAQDGDVACPPAFPTKTVVGASATADCSACSGACAVSATCSGKFSTFTDGACSMNEVDFTADGTCVANPTSNVGPYYYYEYAGSVASAACKGSATSTGTGKLDGTSTVCCKQ